MPTTPTNKEKSTEFCTPRPFPVESPDANKDDTSPFFMSPESFCSVDSKTSFKSTTSNSPKDSNTEAKDLSELTTAKALDFESAGLEVNNSSHVDSEAEVADFKPFDVTSCWCDSSSETSLLSMTLNMIGEVDNLEDEESVLSDVDVLDEKTIKDSSLAIVEKFEKKKILAEVVVHAEPSIDSNKVYDSLIEKHLNVNENGADKLNSSFYWEIPF